MNNYYVVERLSQQRINEALREADRARLAKLAETDRTSNPVWSKVSGKVMLDAAGAREVPSL